MPPRHSESPRIVRRKSAVHGHGVFAVEPITKNTRIIDYAGELVRNGPALNAREDGVPRQGCIWVFRLNRAWSRDADVNGNIARFINHACKPNCYFQVIDQTIWIRAATQHPPRRRTDLRLPDDRRQDDPVPLPAWMPEQV